MDFDETGKFNSANHSCLYMNHWLHILHNFANCQLSLLTSIEMYGWKGSTSAGLAFCATLSMTKLIIIIIIIKGVPLGPVQIL